MAQHLQFLGDASLKFGPIKIDYGPKGTTTHFNVTSPSVPALVNYYNYIIQFGASGTFLGLDVGTDGYTGAEERSLDVSVPGLINNFGRYISQLFFDQWELLTNEATDTIFRNPLIVGNDGGSGWMNANDKDVLSILARDGETVRKSITTADQNIPGNAPHIVPTDARSLQLILDILKGQNEYQKPTYILRHTSYCSPGAYYNTSIENEMCLYTTSQLLSEVGTGWTYNLPPRLYSKIARIPQEFAPSSEATYFTWSWLKRITREPQLSNFMIEVSTEYELALWSNLLYAFA